MSPRFFFFKWYFQPTYVCIYFSHTKFISSYLHHCLSFPFGSFLENNKNRYKPSNCTNTVYGVKRCCWKGIFDQQAVITWRFEVFIIKWCMENALGKKGWLRDVWTLNSLKLEDLCICFPTREIQNSVGWLLPLVWLEYFYWPFWSSCHLPYLLML